MRQFKIINLLFLLLIVAVLACNSADHYSEGGYQYLKNIRAADTNFYFLPLKDTMTTEDSFFNARMRYFFRSFDEPNISLAPLKKSTFRFTLTSEYHNSFIVILTEKLITIKEGNQVDHYNISEDHLNELEKTHLNFLRWNYPFEEVRAKSNRRGQQYMDSMAALYPELKDPNYYDALLNKTMLPPSTPFTYKTSTIPISKKRYKQLISLINNSSYWSLPYFVKCSYQYTDGDVGFALEANTESRYNCVSTGTCPVKSKFLQACQELLREAKMENKVNLMWESLGSDNLNHN
jgi:hypothetical protein